MMWEDDRQKVEHNFEEEDDGLFRYYYGSRLEGLKNVTKFLFSVHGNPAEVIITYRLNIYIYIILESK
jgi:hypothetical protein